ncbi:MAG TPA: site-specific integrase [Candidatus Pacearchaeota archaeon]|nr:site-specific integrase [Candidatus Pacearchaeota archaeon]HDZ61185.1 site-specific integrase [Candidatus Pacearchaeota archaeon]
MTTNDERELEIVNLDELKIKRRESPGHPWKIARRLEKEQAAKFLSIEDIYNRIKKMNNIRDKCLLVMLYITAGRISEIVRRDVVKFRKKEVRLVNKGKVKRAKIIDYSTKERKRIEPSIKRRDLSLQTKDDKKTVVIRMRNLKNKRKGEQVKLIPLPLNSEINKKFFAIIKQYVQILDEDEELFPIGIRRAENIILKAGFNPHFLRSVRLTHLVKYHNFSDQKLKAFSGWSDSRPAAHYIRIGWEDLVSSM